MVGVAFLAEMAPQGITAPQRWRAIAAPTVRRKVATLSGPALAGLGHQTSGSKRRGRIEARIGDPTRMGAKAPLYRETLFVAP